MAAKDPAVIPLPLTRARATEIIREISRDSSRWAVTIEYPPGQHWRRTVNRRQVDLCLREGYVLDEHARLDEHDNWRLRVARVCAGLDVVIDVALERKSKAPRLYVVAIQGDHIGT
jgi:hypothetical protein